MDASARKKLGKIGVLTKENAPDWFQQMESHLRGEKQWKVIREVITEREREAAEVVARTPETTPLPGQATPEGTPEPAPSAALDRLADDEDWDAKNWKAISTITALLKPLDRHTVRKCKYAGDIWTYLTEFYKQSDRTAQMVALKKLITWKMNPNHTIKEAGQEISFIADRVHQVGGEVQSPRLVEVLFLNGLPKQYENSCQLLEFHAKTLDQMIETLSAAEARMKGENETPYGMDIATEESARLSKAEWMKKAECYNCGEVGHIKRHCKKPKKSKTNPPEKKDDSSDDDDKKAKKTGKKKSNDRARKARQQRARAAKDDLDSYDGSSSGSEDSEAARLAIDEFDESDDELRETACYAAENENETAYRATKTDPRWVIDSGATAHCTDDRLIFQNLTPRTGKLTTAGGSLRIVGRGDVIITLPNGSTARLGDVLFVPGIGTNLLSTQALLANGVENHQLIKGVDFYQEGENVAKGSHEGKTSYLTWVRDENALFNESARRISEDTRKKAKPVKPTKKQARKINFENGKRLAKLAKKVDLELFHRRLGHVRTLKHVLKAVRDIEIQGELPEDCEICTRAQRTKVQSHEAVEPASEPAERLHIDFWGPYRQEGMEGSRYILMVTDDCTKHGWIFTTKDRSFETLVEILEPLIKRIERESGRKVKRMRMDNAKEFLKLAKWAEKKGIVAELTSPYTPEQNGVAERANRTLLTIVRALLFDSGLPKGFWPYAAHAAIYIKNRVLKVRGHPGKTPYELWTGKALNLGNMRVWGRECWVHLSNEKDKLNSRAEKGIFIGYTEGFDQYLVLLPDRRRIVKATNPDFKDEGSNSCKPDNDMQLGGVVEPGNFDNLDFDDESSSSDDEDENEDEGENVGENAILPPSSPNPPASEAAPASTPTPTNSTVKGRRKRTRKPAITAPIIEGKRISKLSTRGEEYAASKDFFEPKRRTRRDPAVEAVEAVEAEAANLIVEPDKKFEPSEAAELIYEIALAAKEESNPGQIPIPKTLQEAINHPIYGPKWKEAVEKELAGLASFNTWKLVKKIPGMPIISCKWVFLVKYGTDGRPERFKARLVARGFTQQFGVDYEDTFAPVIRFDSLRVLLALAAKFGWIIHMMDAQNAYLNSELDKDIYMEVPEGVDHLPGQVCELLKSLYGLKQSANLWNKKITKTLRSLGFEQTLADASVFIHPRGIIVALYVDDMLVLGKNLKEVERVKNEVKKLHVMKDLGSISKILGIHVTHQTDGSIKIDQGHYIQQVLAEFGMEHAKRAPVPLSPSLNLEGQDTQLLDPKAHEIYRRMIGRMMFMAIGTRIDIATAVNRLSQYLSEPREIHLQAAKHLLRYLGGKVDLGIVYRADGGNLTVFADAAYANARKFKSTTGFLALIANGPVTWTSRKQTVTAQSTTESEYMALADAAKQAIWLRHLLYAVRKPEVYGKKMTTIYGDNKGSLDLTANPVFHSRTKHIQVRYHAIRDYVERGEIRLQYIQTDEMLADGLTKALDRVKFERMIKGLGLIN